jgi:putative addiction module component (TIGR02574 family)
MTADQIELEALKLPAPQRARLAERLISSLDEESEVEKEWLVEVRRRDTELDSGEVEGIPLEDALSTVRGKFDW